MVAAAADAGAGRPRLSREGHAKACDAVLCPVQNLIQINVAPASDCSPVIATVLPRMSVAFNLRKLEAARLGGLFLAAADL